MTLQQTKNLSDVIYTARESGMIDRQDAYILTHDGKYFQGLDTNDPLPANGNEMAPNFLHQPTDQVATWTPADFPPNVPSSLRIDVYTGNVAGWVATLSFTYGGLLWQKAHGYGDVTSLSHDWLSYEEDAI